MNLNQIITLSPDVISQEVSGETVLLDLESENYFGLDEVGTRIWQLIKETRDLQAIYDTLLAEYDVEEERLLHDLAALLGQPLFAGLTAPKGRRMGHAGAIISAFGESASEKVEILKEAGVTVAPNPAEMGITVAEVLKAA